eukprot:TRINITY_DN1084_c0_g1_i5.p2 TRINITY_DN1084_c0_g1~~TRINITY_DN1084_c0_g1_i5.p2  ORF type:complete len:115 (-),score=38.66 TRINITY_DN1084_c0_g1_i5:119-463(-)
MKCFAALILTVACVHVALSETVDIDWTLGMTENAVCVPPGSIINFVWEHGHNVVEVATQEDFDACTGFTDHAAYTGPLAWPVPEAEGTYYIVCGVGSHCDVGNRKLAVTVAHHC